MVQAPEEGGSRGEDNWVTANRGWWRNLAIVGGALFVIASLFTVLRPPSSAEMDAFAGNIMLLGLVTITTNYYLYRRASRSR